ncbi:MAG: hypothetical protein WCO90_06475 [Planctomycetota bacterium]
MVCGRLQSLARGCGDDAAAVALFFARKHIDILRHSGEAEQNRPALSDEQVINAGLGECHGHLLSLQGITLRTVVHSGGAG